MSEMTERYLSYQLETATGLTPFDLACRELLITGFLIDWHDAPRRGTDSATGDIGGDAPKSDKKSGKRERFTCPGCGLNAWAKHSARLQCGECSATMIVANVNLRGATIDRSQME